MYAADEADRIADYRVPILLPLGGPWVLRTRVVSGASSIMSWRGWGQMLVCRDAPPLPLAGDATAMSPQSDGDRRECPRYCG
jgi:hypothetical protein